MTAVATKRRTAPKQERQLQLIKATIRSVAKRGLSNTTMATVAKEAKLSQGIINLHFQKKDKLLVETLRYLADEYEQAWEAAIAEAGASAAERLAALVAVDFDKAVCERNKIAVWFAFWGETRSRPTYRRICAERDRRYMEMLVALCTTVAHEGGYEEADGATIASGLSAMSEGLWLDLLISPESMDRAEAKRICFAYLSSAFPRHFSHEGAAVRDA